MSDFKSIADIIEVAIRIERQGIDFYKKLHDQSSSPQARDTFFVLAAEEEMHAGVFRKILADAVDYTPRFDYPGEYGMFLNGCATAVLKKVAGGMASLSAGSISEALAMGIEFEKESILFYLELLEEGAFTEEKHSAIKQLINEERLHLKRLFALKKIMKL